MKTTTLVLAMILACAVHSPTQGKNSLHEAAQNGTRANVAALLKAGADPNARDRNGKTPLYAAAYRNDNPALHFAAHSNKNPAVITALLNSDANINARTANGMAPADEE